MQDELSLHGTLIFILSNTLLSKKSWITASLVRTKTVLKILFNKIKPLLKWNEGMLNPFKVGDAGVT